MVKISPIWKLHNDTGMKPYQYTLQKLKPRIKSWWPQQNNQVYSIRSKHGVHNPIPKHNFNYEYCTFPELILSQLWKITRHVLTGQIPPASTTPVSWTSIKSSPSPSNLTLKSYGPDTDFGYVCTVTLTLELGPWVKAWPTLKSWTTIVWNIIQIQHGSEELLPRHGFCV